MLTPLDSRNIDATPLVNLEIAISGEGDVPAKICGVTMKLTEGMAEFYDNDWFDNDEVSTYLTGATITDDDYMSQTVKATPITLVDEHTYAPIAIGITKGLYDHLLEEKNKAGYTVGYSIITEDDEYTLTKPTLYTDGEGNHALLGLLPVEGIGNTQLSNDDWNGLYVSITGGGESVKETYEFTTETTVAPDVITFTPEPIS